MMQLVSEKATVVTTICGCRASLTLILQYRSFRHLNSSQNAHINQNALINPKRKLNKTKEWLFSPAIKWNQLASSSRAKYAVSINVNTHAKESLKFQVNCAKHYDFSLSWNIVGILCNSSARRNLVMIVICVLIFLFSTTPTLGSLTVIYALRKA